MSGLTRREAIGAATLGAAAIWTPPAAARRLRSRRVGVGIGRFRDGVASGEPGPRSITLWSRLRTDAPRSGARLVVARDEDMRRTVATRVVPTGRGVNGTLKARIGGLKPSTEYFYVWESGSDVSPVGRARTLPHPTSEGPVQLAFSSCQHYARGHFSPHVHAAAQDLDLAVFLGDYIYAERGRPVIGDARVDRISANDLGSYRRKYQRYRTDPGLNELHRLHPSVHIWDDHEVENNYTDNRPAPSPLQRTAGYRAAFEWLPRRVDPRDRFRLYKRIPLGRTADLFLLDARQYRTVDAENRPLRLLGDEQRQWLINGLRASRARWKIIANPVLVAPMDLGGGAWMDSWAGYDASRTSLLAEIEHAGIDNVVVYTGDAHVFMVNALASDRERFRRDPGHRPTAMEYVSGSVTSPGAYRDPADVHARNPWNQYYNGVDHGYAHVTLDGGQLVTDYMRSDITRPDGVTLPLARFTQPAGVNRAYGSPAAPAT